MSTGAVALTGSAVWRDSGGVDGSGYISITDAVGGQQGVMILPEIDPGEAIGGFKADFRIRIGGGTARPADGIAFVFAPEVNEGSNFGEEGLGTGLSVCFDTWDNNGSDTAPAIDVKVGGTADGNIVSTTFLGGVREGGRARPGPIFTDPGGAEVDLGTGDEFAALSVEVRNGLLNVHYKGHHIVKDVVTAFAPVPGRFAFGGRTGGAWDNQWIDNLRIETFPRTAPSIAGVRGTANGFTVQVEDAPGASVNASSVAVTLNGTAITGTATKTGTRTVFSYTNPTLFASGSTQNIVVSYTYGTANTPNSHTLSITTPNYTVIPAANALPAGAVNTANTGFHWNVHQADAAATLANSSSRAESQLAGGFGDNIADPNAQGAASGPAAAPSPASANLNFIVPGVINFSQFGGDLNGNVQPDEQMPGIPGVLGGTDSIAAEIITAIEFPAAGSYTMIVNSDDGFRTTHGKNPRDIVDATQIGIFEGGRGASDTVFNIYVEAPGRYGFRTLWYEGGGGANIEWLSEQPDGTRLLINAANPQALKAYQLPASALPAYVKGLLPGRGALPVVQPQTIEAVLVDGSTTVTTSSVTLKLNGQTVQVTATKTGATTRVVHNTGGALPTNTQITAELTFTDSAGTSRTVSWQFNSGVFSPNLFVIEAEDFNYDGGLFNPLKGLPEFDVDVMPYRGGAYDQYSAIEGIDFVNGDGPDSDVYRFEIGDDGDHEINITAANNVGPGNGLGGTIPIGSSDRGAFTMTSNYRIGWVAAGEWQNYTRTFPNNAFGGWWKVYAALSYDGNAAGQLSASLARVTSPATQANQTTEPLGTFNAPGSGGWGLNNLVPMKTATGADAVVRLTGVNTVRFNLGSGDFDFLIFNPAPPPPPSVSGVPIDSVKRDAVILNWTLADAEAKVNPSTVKVTFGGQDVTAKATTTKTATGATVVLDLTGTTYAPGEYPWTLEFKDDGAAPQTVTASGVQVVNPYPTPGVFVIEAEDFNYSDDGVTGGKTNPQAGTADLDVNVMPYLGGAYAGLSAVKGVDYNNSDGNDSDVYRSELDGNGENEINIAAETGNRYAVDRGVFTVTSNYKIGWIGAGDWQNYTRTVPAGTYQVWAAMSYDGRAAGQLNGSLALVTSNPAQANQTVQALGTFNAPGSGGWSRNELVPMKTSAGAIATYTSDGTSKTFRFSNNSGDFDYFLFVPTTGGGGGGDLRITGIRLNASGQVVIEWTGGGTLQSAPSVTGPWTNVAGASSGHATAPSGAAGYFRITR